MNYRFLNPLSFLTIFSLAVLLSVTSCEKEPEQIDLPPAESLVMDLSQFPKKATKAVGKSFGNWFYASGSVFVWNAVIVANVAIPVTAYAEAFNHTPVYLDDNSWEWSYSVVVNDKTYETTLVGSRIDRATFSMTMSLSEVGGFQNFEWFNGVIRYDHTEADWTLSHSPLNPTDYLQIHYEKDFDTEIRSIRYTVIDPENEIYDAYIEYGLDPALDFDAHYIIYKEENTSSIEWNTDTKAGHVKDPLYFQDELWHCWDGLQQDVDCR